MREHPGVLTPRQVLVLMVVCMLLYGALAGDNITRHAHRAGVGPPFEIVFSFLSFYWYRLDSDERRYRRSKPLNVGVIAVAAVALPYYLVRSRPAGQRLRALLRLAGFALALGVGAVVGAVIAAMLG